MCNYVEPFRHLALKKKKKKLVVEAEGWKNVEWANKQINLPTSGHLKTTLAWSKGQMC